ncbi:hypothetical protein ACFFRR_003674 [Megaselia abdita]
MKVVFAVLVILSIFALATCYDCTKENSNRSRKESLKEWNAKSEEEYKKFHKNCLVRHLSMNYVDLAKCIDKKTGVIDGDSCYLTPRAVEQYDILFEIKKSDIEKTVKKCHKDNFAGGVLDYTKYYKCIETIQ